MHLDQNTNGKANTKPLIFQDRQSPFSNVVVPSTAGAGHKGKVAASTTSTTSTTKETIKPTNPLKKEINAPTKTPDNENSTSKFYHKIQENSHKWVKFNNKFAETIAKSGIYITFKKGHKRQVLSKFTKFPKERKFSLNQKQKIYEQINKLLELDVISKCSNSTPARSSNV